MLQPAFSQTVKENVFQVENIAPVAFKTLPDGTCFADFGKDAFGTLVLKYAAKKPGELTICLGEKLLNGRLDTNPGGTIRYAEVKLPVTPQEKEYTIRLTADKRNTSGAAVILPDSFGVVMPFRYVEIKNARQPIRVTDLYQKAFFCRFDGTSSAFGSSDTTLNQVWEMCKYSMKATSFTGIYIDGDRERIAYEADAYINQLGHYAVDTEYAMAQRTIEHFFAHPTWPTEWQLHMVLMMYQDYYYTGDLTLLKKYYDQLKYKTLIDLAREDGLISTTTGKVTAQVMKNLGFTDPKQQLKDIVDWPPGQKDTGWKLVNAAGERDGHEMLPVNTVVNCFFYENMKLMTEIAAVLGNREDQALFSEMAKKVKLSINQLLFNKTTGTYVDGEGSSHSSLHSNMMALAFGIVPRDRVQGVVAFVKSRGMACSVYGSQFLLEGLYHYGQGQYALDLMRSTSDRSWYNMIRSGSTISLEAWDMKYKPNSDWNHAWGAAPANIIARQLWGIRPAIAGFKLATIQPQPGDLTTSNIKVPTLLGPILASFKTGNNGLKSYEIELPSGMKGAFSLPGNSRAEIVLNGKKIDAKETIIQLNSGKNRLQVKEIIN